MTPLLILDGYARFYMGLIVASAFATALLGFGYLEKRCRMDGAAPEEFYVLLLLATLGAGVLVASSHFASFFLGLEILSVPLYTLIAYTRAERNSIEAGLKYLILAAASAAFLLFGMALVYAQLGTMELARIAQLGSGAGSGRQGLLGVGFGMIVVGIGYKLAVVPFHMWTPDVYQGAPAPVTAFLATVSKGAMFALLLRYFTSVALQHHRALFLIFTILAVASMVIGNLLALLQDNVKRLLAYSSIAHLGYLLVAFLASGALAPTAVAFYLVAYFVTTLGAFGIVTVLSTGEREAEGLEDYRSLYWRHPWLTGIFTALLLSLAGIPFTAGFVGKFYLAVAAVGSSLWLLVIVLVLTSTVGLFYYLRVVVTMYMPAPAEERALAGPAAVSLGGSLVLGALTLLLVWFGVYPAPLIHWIQIAGGSRPWP
jgi:NADH-quinone oxidoreductase subunit N